MRIRGLKYLLLDNSGLTIEVFVLFRQDCEAHIRKKDMTWQRTKSPWGWAGEEAEHLSAARPALSLPLSSVHTWDPGGVSSHYFLCQSSLLLEGSYSLKSRCLLGKIYLHQYLYLSIYLYLSKYLHSCVYRFWSDKTFWGFLGSEQISRCLLGV